MQLVMRNIIHFFPALFYLIYNLGYFTVILLDLAQYSYIKNILFS